MSKIPVNSYQYYKQIFAGRQMPFTFLDIDLLNQNIRQILRRVRGKTIRIASKSVRSRPILARILASSPIFQGVMCYTAAEAVFLSKHGLDDLLIGYPTWNVSQIEAICEQVRQGATIVAMVDSVAHIEHLAAIAQAQGVVLPVCLDLDLSVQFPGLYFGVWRSSVRSAEDALRVYAAIERSPHLRLDGIMGYEAQIAGVGDTIPGQRPQSTIIRILKQRSLPVIARRRAAVVQALTERGAALRIVNGGGTGSIETTCCEPAVTEVTVGSGFYAPALFDRYQAFRHQPAAGFAIEIVRQPAPGIYTCLGGGYIASGSSGPEKLPVPYLPQGARLITLEGAGEVQTPVAYTGPEQLELGSPVFLRHAKAGELCEHFEELLLISNGTLIGSVPTYRGEGQCFL